jgi:hypothetical protein
MTRHRLLLFFAVATTLFLIFFKPAVIRTDNETRLAALFRWQSGQIHFVNSVTGYPVTIRFRVGRRFQAFSFSTNETTEDYYTSGLYDLNRTVAKESTDSLRFCSIKGISLRIGFYSIFVKNGCLEVTLLWTI